VSVRMTSMAPRNARRLHLTEPVEWDISRASSPLERDVTPAKRIAFARTTLLLVATPVWFARRHSCANLAYA